VYKTPDCTNMTKRYHTVIQLHHTRMSLVTLATTIVLNFTVDKDVIYTIQAA